MNIFDISDSNLFPTYQILEGGNVRSSVVLLSLNLNLLQKQNKKTKNKKISNNPLMIVKIRKETTNMVRSLFDSYVVRLKIQCGVL